MTFFIHLGNSFIYNAIYKLEKTKIIYKIYFSQSLQPFTFQMSKTIYDTKFIVDFEGQIGQKGQKGHLFSPVFFPRARVEISRVSRARRVRKQATIKFGQ